MNYKYIHNWFIMDILGHRQGCNGDIFGLRFRVIVQSALRTHAHDHGVLIGIANGIDEWGHSGIM